MKRLLSVLLVLTLMLQMVPVQTLAAALPGTTVASTVANSAAGDVSEQTPVTILGEAEELRTETEKHFHLSDGSNIAVSYGMPVHYQDESGAWQDIVNEPVMTYGAAGSDFYRITNEELTTVFFGRSGR